MPDCFAPRACHIPAMTTSPRPDRRRFIAAAAAFTAAPSLVRAADATLDATLAEAAALGLAVAQRLQSAGARGAH